MAHPLAGWICFPEKHRRVLENPVTSRIEFDRVFQSRPTETFVFGNDKSRCATVFPPFTKRLNVIMLSSAVRRHVAPQHLLHSPA